MDLLPCFLGSERQLTVYAADDPRREPTERYFEAEVRRLIDEVRGGDFTNLRNLVRYLREADMPDGNSFESSTTRIGIVLGKKTCRQIGKRVCIKMGFTVQEGETLIQNYRQQRANELGLDSNASWAEIREAQFQRDR